MADIFDLFGGGGGRGRSGPRKSDNVNHKLMVSLEDMYNGTTKKLSLSRNMPCEGCKGSGTKSGRKMECGTCRGTGIQVTLRQLGPGMLQQMQSRCSACNGQGTSVPPSDRCTKCDGKGLCAEKKTFEVHVEQGMRTGSRIVLRGEAGCSEPGLLAGDVILTIVQKVRLAVFYLIFYLLYAALRQRRALSTPQGALLPGGSLRALLGIALLPGGSPLLKSLVGSTGAQRDAAWRGGVCCRLQTHGTPMGP